MTFSELLSLIATTSAVLSLIIVIVLNWKIEVVRRATDGMKNELVHEVRVSSLAKGKLEEQELVKSKKRRRKRIPNGEVNGGL
jgi:hypothetical protein